MRVKRRHFVLQPCQFDRVIVRNQIGTRGQYLPEFDENRPQAFQRQTQAHGRHFVFELGRLRQHIEESPRPTRTDQRGNQLGKAVAVERAEDGFDAFEAVHDGRR